MANVYWFGPAGSQSNPTSGQYGDAANWSSGHVPGQYDDVWLGAGDYQVTRSSFTSAVKDLLIGSGVGFSTAASFQSLGWTQVDGRLTLGGDLVSSFLYGQGTVVGSGTISSYIGAAHTAVGIVPTPLNFNATGTLTFNSPSPFRSQIGGTLGGSGTVDLHSGAFVLAKGTKLTSAGLALSGGEVFLGQSLSYKGSFSMSGGTLAVADQFAAGSRLTLGGSNIFVAGTVNSDVALTGQTTIASYGWTVGEQGRVSNTGHVGLVGGFKLAEAGTFVNASAGTFSITRGGQIGAASGATGAFYNQGTLTVSGSYGALIEARLVNTGKLDVTSGYRVKLAGGVSGSGAILIAGHGTLEIASAITKTQAIGFAAGDVGTLLIDAGQSFAGTVAGFVAGDTLDFGGIGPSGARVAYNGKADNSGGTLIVKNATQRTTIDLAGQFIASAFHVAADGQGGTAVTYTPSAQANLMNLAAAHV